MNKQDNKCLALIVPCMNEQEVLQKTNSELLTLLNKLIDNLLINSNSYIYYVDDGSTDETWPIIKQLCSENKNVSGLKLSKNFGHQNALLAGLTRVNNKCDYVVTIDADLQQDINAIPEMIDKHYSGVEIIFGVRNNRLGDSLFKKKTGDIYTTFINYLGGNLVKGHADFRLMGKKSVRALLEYSENNIFIRGIVPELGFKSSIVKFEQKNRIAGETKYTKLKMFQLAYKGLTSITIAPLRFLIVLGGVSLILSFCYVIYVLYTKYVVELAVPGWASIVLPIWIFSSLQLLSIGLLGEYISRIFLDIKKRPRFIFEDEL
jgi:glycosyltransferase involved in cell wall biosynthesis